MPKNFKTRKTVKDRFIIDNMNESHIEKYMQKKVELIKKELGLNKSSVSDYVNLNFSLGIWDSLRVSIGFNIGGICESTVSTRCEKIQTHIEVAKKQIELEQLKMSKDGV